MKLGPIYQMALIVADLDTAIAAWTRGGTAGPFYRFDDFVFEEPWCAPGLALPAIGIALGQSGDLNIELIAVRPGPPSLFGGPPGLHHVARRAADVDAALAELAAGGAPTLFRARFAGGVACGFADTRSALGCLTEVVAADAGVDAMLARMRAEHDGWDGSAPERRF